MADEGQGLELTWADKELPPPERRQILVERPSWNEGQLAQGQGSAAAVSDNMLIHGDNLAALGALGQSFAGQIRCVYLDPPFNTGQCFEHYEDGMAHAAWLDLMARRLRAIRPLLRPDGVLFVHLDQEEVHYLKVVLDEVFGRGQFLGQIAYERSGVSGLGQGGAFLVNTHEYILVYARERARFSALDMGAESVFEEKAMRRYKRALACPGRRREVARFTAASTGEPVVIYAHDGARIEKISLRDLDRRRDVVERQYIEGFERIFRLTSVQKENEFQNRILGHCQTGVFSADYLVARGKREGQHISSYYVDGQVAVWLRDTARVEQGRIVRTGKLSDFWGHADVPKANLAREGGVPFRRGKKPEYLIRRLLGMVTEPGDWVLDAFGGSGTTGAVAHKLGRRWIMIEQGEHCYTHIRPRLARVIAGQDPTGVSAVAGWRGGGGYRFFELTGAPAG